MFTIAALLLGLAILVAVFGFTALSGPYVGPARVVAYSLTVLFVLVLLIGLLQHCQAGPQRTVAVPLTSKS
jgi:uncharacterized membrane protein YtjA (UPF0391 family)